jgi:hypothetical protein
MSHFPDDNVLLTKVHQPIRQLEPAWVVHKATLKAYTKHPSKFTERPKLPKYKHRLNLVI